MGNGVLCPRCGHKFFVHGYERVAECFECGKMLNPQRNRHKKIE